MKHRTKILKFLSAPELIECFQTSYKLIPGFVNKLRTIRSLAKTITTVGYRAKPCQ